MSENKGKGKAKSSSNLPQGSSAGSSTSPPRTSTSHSTAADTSSKPAASLSVMPEISMAGKTLRLNCIMDGESSSFPVDIASSESVSTLKDEIKKKKDPEFNEIAADKLTLFHIDGGATKGQLSTASRKKLDDELESLETYFRNGADKSLIYIVVQPPSQAHAGTKRDFETAMFGRFDRMETAFKELKEEKKTVISISKVTQQHYNDILAEHGLQRQTAVFTTPPTTKHIQPFSWDGRHEAAHAHDYEAWLDKYITLPQDVIFYRASGNSSLLNTPGASIKYDLRGTTDLALMEKAFVNDRNYASGLQIGVELKKSVGETNTMQAILQLLAASLSSNYCPVIILTDLMDCWSFFWLEPRAIKSCTLGLLDGVALLEAIAREPRSTALAIPAIPATPNTPYRRRCQYADAVRRTHEETVM
ncbi:hypothetical protein EMPS_09915 [Entomortierella parvispora]|uniref:Crinkler effector protein N-terminal domain-containing protein n=1 Tax=Entomortierella parvispora TaxID=205924 RepID=A0A9P3HJ26_9FUNG|nr:hypothetical protein EMPS_09915 [Entomortierella parvispora]